MAELIWIFGILFSIVFMPIWIWRRMRAVRQRLYTVETETETAPHHREQTEEIVSQGADGLALVRLHDGNADLIAADKAGREMPDIARTLSGQR